MGKGKDLSDFDKGQIVMAKRLGESSSRISALVGCSRSTVISIYQKWCKEGEAASRRQGHGRPRLIDTLGERRLARLVESDRTATVAQIAEKVNAISDKKVSSHTVHRSLLRMGLRRKKVNESMLANVRRQKRLLWALEHEEWAVEQWKRVAWSREARFRFHEVGGQVAVRRLPEDGDGDGDASYQSSGYTVTLWGMFCWETLGPVIHVDDFLTPNTYTSILADHVHPFMNSVFPEGSGFFQQDSSSSSSDSVQEWFEEHDDEFKELPWPPDSAELNPMEQLWDVLDQQIRSMHASPLTSLEELKNLLQASWTQIPQDTFRGLVESMPHRVKAVLQSRGGPLNYVPGGLSIMADGSSTPL
ncbi:unnamed protein product [Knipowitschia caucasica]|uniref:Transposase Tc1-like domain-containing protein n=1 Tax=Knipowitschia caucasica TaxID=637954 RepID=A0AAV2LCL0_KNICA